MIRPLPPELAKIAKKELNENPKQFADDLLHLKEWIAKQPHLRARTDEQWLIAILRGCKFSLERVKSKLDLYYTLRTTAADVILRMTPIEPKFIEFFRRGTCVILPHSKKKLHPRTILIRAGEYEVENNNVADIMCILYYLVQILVVEDDIASVVGTKIMVDYRGVTLSHLTQVSPGLMKKLVAVSQDSLPLRLKGSHHMNVPSGIEIIFKIVSGFLNQKAKERLRIHKTHEELLEVVPPDSLPEEYGGTAGTLNEIIEYWVDKFKEYRSWMETELTFGTDESKRTGDCKKDQGSFRKLDIDDSVNFENMNLRQLPPHLLEKAKKELDEDPNRLQSDITALRTWLAKQPHLESVNISDQMLVAFLRGSKYSLERSKEKLDLFYTLRTLTPEFYGNRDPLEPKIQELLKLGVFLPLRNCNKDDSPRTCLVRCGLIDPSRHHLSDLVKMTFMITEILLLEDDNFSVAGEETLVDIKGIGMGLVSQWTPTLAKKIITCFEKAIPLRLKSIHLLNTPPGLETAYAIFRAFLGEKLKKRIFLHNQNYKALYKEIPKRILPKEYGGEDGSVEELTDFWKTKVESYREWFLKEEKACSDETKRPGKPKTTSVLFGVEGSFRKLEVD
ncbi:uncharacterized protein [Epargyreus clarus]|uniref:uncharacterized protein n=1 Tax=Epargyreus clarus TaxID=520877 RepID=UPI003C2B4176